MRQGVLCQVQPRSFADGIGDLASLVDPLEYLEWLGIDGVWLDPDPSLARADGVAVECS